MLVRRRFLLVVVACNVVIFLQDWVVPASRDLCYGTQEEGAVRVQESPNKFIISSSDSLILLHLHHR
jgi:hypothetical protein